MEPMAVTIDLVIIAILFVIAMMLTRDRSRAWLLAQASGSPDATVVRSTPRSGSFSTPSCG